MRKSIFLLAVVLVGWKSMSQKAEKPSIEFGPRFGLLVSELNGAENLKSVRASFTGGFMAEFKVKSSLAVYAEVSYSRQGSTNRGDNEGSPFDNRLNLDYINIPLFIKYYLKEGLAIELGPQLGFLMNAKYLSRQVESPLTRDITNDFESLDVSLGLGACYKTDWGFIFGLRYTFGFNSINKSIDYESAELRNAVFQLHFGYLFK